MVRFPEQHQVLYNIWSWTLSLSSQNEEFKSFQHFTAIRAQASPPWKPLEFKSHLASRPVLLWRPQWYPPLPAAIQAPQGAVSRPQAARNQHRAFVLHCSKVPVRFTSVTHQVTDIVGRSEASRAQRTAKSDSGDKVDCEEECRGIRLDIKSASALYFPKWDRNSLTFSLLNLSLSLYGCQEGPCSYQLAVVFWWRWHGVEFSSPSTKVSPFSSFARSLSSRKNNEKCLFLEFVKKFQHISSFSVLNPLPI